MSTLQSIHGIGPKTLARLKRMQITTTQDLSTKCDTIADLQKILGNNRNVLQVWDALGKELPKESESDDNEDFDQDSDEEEHRELYEAIKDKCTVM